MCYNGAKKNKGEKIMLKISNKASANLSLIFSGVFMAALTVMYFIMPLLITRFCDVVNVIRPVSKLGYIYLGIIGYLVLIVATATDILLFALLFRVKRGLVFSERSVAYIRYISWSVFAEAFLFLLIAPYSLIGIFIFIAAFMLGMALRVVKNVISEAVQIKIENDFTV